MARCLQGRLQAGSQEAAPAGGGGAWRRRPGKQLRGAWWPSRWSVTLHILSAWCVSGMVVLFPSL